MGYREVILAAAPVAYWRLGETSGTSAADETGNGFTGTYTGTYSLDAAGPIASEGPRGGAVRLAGTGYVAIGDLSALTVRTVAAWVRPTAAFPSDLNLQSVVGGGPYLTIGEYGFPRVFVTGGTGWSAFPMTGTTLDAWNRVVATADGANIRMYLNGVLIRTQASSGTIQTGIDARIGQRPDYPADFLNADVSHVLIGTTAWTAAQVRRDYSEGLASAGLKRVFAP